MATPKDNTMEREKSGLQKAIFKYLPYWPMFLSIMALALGVLYFYIKVTPPLYETAASILIKDEQKGQEDSKMEEVLNMFGTKKIVENEIEILQSNETIGRVIRKMRLYAPVTAEVGWKGLIERSAYLTSPIVIEAPEPAILKNSGKIYFDYNETSKTVLIEGTAFPLDKWVPTKYGRLRFLKNDKFEKFANFKATAFYFTLMDFNKVIKNFSQSLVISPVSRQSSVVNMKIKDETTKRGEEILNQIVDAYNFASIERKSGVAAKTLRFIEDRLRNVSLELDSVEGSIQKYRDQAGAVDLSEQSRLYLQSIEENDRKANEINLKLSALDEVEKYVVSKAENSGSISPSIVNIDDPSLTQLLQKLSTSESEYQRLRQSTGENNPIAQAVQDDIIKTKPSILENIRNQKKTLQAGKSYLGQVSGKYSSMVSTIPKKERELVEVSRQQNIKNAIYSFLLQKREETQYSISSALPDCYMIDQPASSIYPVSPKKPLLGLFALIFPLAIGGLFINIKDSLNRKILYRTSIEQLTKFPIIGELIFEKLDNPLVTAGTDSSFLSEQFRLIRTSLKYQGNPQGNTKRILVTSSIMGEGKSFVSSNLAISLAKSGKKVALLELDLHKPKLSSMMNIGKEIGLTDYLSGKTTMSEIIFESYVHPNLNILPAGNLISEPSELLSNGKLEKLLEFLDTKFDHIIIDTAPVKACIFPTNGTPLGRRSFPAMIRASRRATADCS